MEEIYSLHAPKPKVPARHLRGQRAGQILVIKIDPDRRTVVKMLMRCGHDATPAVRRMLKVQDVGHYELTRIQKQHVEIPLIVAAGTEVCEEMRGWRLRGGEDTAGIGLLFGKGPGGGMVSVPVDIAWVEREIVWLDGEQKDAA